MKSYWTCRGCKTRHPRTKRKCPCGRARPPKRVVKHQQVLVLHAYDQWVAWFGDRCNICGRPAGPKRNLDRDHDHRTGEPRGLLCHRCNRALPEWMTEEWMRKALAYLARPRPQIEGENEVIDLS